MLSFLKYLPLVGAFKDVSAAYQEETGKGRPVYLNRRFLGSAITLIGVALSVFFGTKLDSTVVAQLTDNVEKLVSAGVTLYGVVLATYGVVAKKSKEVK